MLELLEASGVNGDPSSALRRCSRCGELKPIDDFPIKNQATGLRRVWCRSCCRAYGREHYQRCRPVYLEKAAWRRKVERPIVRERVFEYLRAHPCVDCGESEIALLDFDHRDPSPKRITVSRLIRSASWPTAEQEIAKCDVRCANCHRRRTAEQFGWAKAIGVDLEPGLVRPGASSRYATIEFPRQDPLLSDDEHGLRRCSRCGEFRALAEFGFQDLRSGRKAYYCRRCQADYRREHYSRNKPDYIRRAIEEQRLKKQDTLVLLHDHLRAHPCVDCGERDIVTLDFDHVDPTKKSLEISQMVGHRPWSVIVAEIEKCEVRCANCHRRRTAQQQGWLKGLGERSAAYS